MFSLRLAVYVVLLLAPWLLSAHPHVFIENDLTFLFDEKGLSGFKQRWVFDEMSSAGYVVDYDLNRNGRLEPQEVTQLKAGAFDNLKHFHYMTYVEIGGKQFTVSYVTGFNAIIKDSKLIYEFTIPCLVTATGTEKTIKVAVYDDEFFVDFGLQQKAIRLEHDDRFRTTVTIGKNTIKSHYFGQLNPIEMILSFKNGN